MHFKKIPITLFHEPSSKFSFCSLQLYFRHRELSEHIPQSLFHLFSFSLIKKPFNVVAHFVLLQHCCTLGSRSLIRSLSFSFSQIQTCS